MCFNAEYPAHTRRRITRESSRNHILFPRDAPGLQVRSKHPYNFLDLLERQNTITSFLEEKDPVYRGDVRIILFLNPWV